MPNSLRMKNVTTNLLISALASIVQASAATLTAGHVDAIGIGYEGGEIDPHSHAEAGAIVDGLPLDSGTEYAPGELTILVTTNVLRDANSVWQPVGIGAGVSYWYLPQDAIEADTLGAPFTGIGAEELVPGDWVTPITLTLTSFTSPVGANFSLWQVDSFDTPTFFMSTADGVSSADHYDITAGDHAHFGWGFTAPGEYDLTFGFSGEHAIDGVKTATASYRFSVIPEPSAALMGVFGMLLLARRRR